MSVAKEVTKCIYGHKLVNKNNIYKIDQFNVSEKDPLLYNLKSNLLFASLPEYLRYEDRNSMAFSKEARLPFLDYRLVEWGFGIANNLKINHGISKYVMRKSISNYTTKSVVESKKKMGFISPQENWQKNKLYQWLNERSEVPSFFKDNKKIKNLENDSWLKWRLASFNEWKNSFGK